MNMVKTLATVNTVKGPTFVAMGLLESRSGMRTDPRLFILLLFPDPNLEPHHFQSVLCPPNNGNLLMYSTLSMLGFDPHRTFLAGGAGTGDRSVIDFVTSM